MTFHRKPRLKVASKSVERVKAIIREACRQGKGQRLGTVIKGLGPKLRGWVNYFRYSEVKGLFEELDGWVRRKLRCILWRQWKRTYTRARNLIGFGLPKETALKSAMNGRGPWWNAGAAHMHKAIGKPFFERLGLVSLMAQYHRLQVVS
jgi:hypothetical protein